MGTIRARGAIILDLKNTREKEAPFDGVVRKLTDPNFLEKRSQSIMTVFCLEIFLTQQALVNNINPITTKNKLISELLEFGMSHSQIKWVLENRKPIGNIPIFLPNFSSFDKRLSIGQEFRKGQTLFRYGPLSASCDLNKAAAACVELGDACLCVLEEWPEKMFTGYLSEVRRHWYSAELRTFVIEIKSLPVTIPVGTVLSVSIETSRVSGHVNGSFVPSPPEPTAQQSDPGGRINRDPALERAYAQQRQAREAEKKAAISPFQTPVPPWFQAGRYPTQRIKLSKNDTKPEMLPLKVWEQAELKMIKVEKRVPRHRFAFRATVKHLYKLNLTPRINVDPVLLPLDDSEYRELFFLEIIMHEVEFCRYRGRMDVTVHQEADDRTFNARPYAPEKSPEGYYRFGLQLPRDLAAEGEKVWALMTDSEPGPEVNLLPEQCVVSTTQGTQVLAHIEERRLVPLTVRVGPTTGGMVEVLEGLRTGDNVCLKPKEQRERLLRLRTAARGGGR